VRWLEVRARFWRRWHDLRWHNVLTYDEGDGEWGFFCCACSKSTAATLSERTP
jgi:hypothetical protein